MEKSVKLIGIKQDDMFEFLKNNLNKQSLPNQVVPQLRSPIYPGSWLIVDSDRLDYALQANTACSFASRMITCVYSVSELYRTTATGQKRHNSLTENCRSLDGKLKNEIIKAAKYHYKDDKSANKTNFTRSFGNKTSALQKLFGLMKTKNLSKLPNKITKFDLLGFEEFQEFKNDPSKFKKLDDLIAAEIDEQSDKTDTDNEQDDPTVTDNEQDDLTVTDNEQDDSTDTDSDN